MVFSSLVFICVLLPITLILHAILPEIRGKNTVLLVVSLLFYSYGEPIYVFLLIGSAFFNYICALLVAKDSAKKKIWITAGITVNLGILILFKYAGFLVECVNGIFHLRIPMPEIAMPLGISFFTFQAMSYVIDVYREKTKEEMNFGRVLLYITFFPQLIAGPIVKYHDIALEIQDREQTIDGTVRGIRRFCAGLCKKILIANTMGMAADTLFAAGAGEVNAAVSWLGVLSYVIQIYFDFGGYSDMAIGLGWMFGFHFKENFNYPYISKSIREFWKRWHISLTDWFREYLYIPLGGNRKGKLRTVCNKMLVFLCTGIWHGAALNFLVWGIYHGCFMMLEEYVPAIGRKGNKIKSFFQHIYTMLTVSVGFLIFRADSMGQAFLWLKEMFTGFAKNDAAMSLAMQQLTPVYLVTLIAAVAAAVPVNQMLGRIKGVEIFRYICSMAGFVLCILYLASGTYNPFIYFRF